MQKIVVIFIVISIFLLSGCNNKEAKQEQYEQLMQQYGVDYYEKFGHKQISNFSVDIAAMKKANDKELTSYDLEKLKNCDDSSKVTFTIDIENNWSIVDTEFEMTCK
jgi:hypothetical protein